MHKKLTCLWFLLGLGLRLQVISSLSISEIIILIGAPYLFFKNNHYMKRDGVVPLFALSLLVILGCIIGSIANRTPAEYVLRGLAVTCIVSCAIIVSHWLLRNDPSGFKWFVLGVPISAIISTFYFKSSVEVASLGDAADQIMSGPIFWISRLNPLLLAPIKGWYLSMPLLFSFLMPLGVAVFSIMVSVSGRSAALAAIGFAVLVLIGGKTRRSISRISRHFGLFCLCGVLIIALVYIGYKFSASQGWLGEDARKKYESQTYGGQGGIGRLLLGGRGESFIGLLACRDKPIIGWGPWAKDENGYTEEFVRRYGTWEDFETLVRLNDWRLKNGVTVRLLPCHSYITEFWAWYGIFGLAFWLYVIYVLLRYLKQDVASVPQWFAWLACAIPGMTWGIFFSPFSDRVGVVIFVVACIMARSVRRGTLLLPNDMNDEIR